MRPNEVTLLDAGMGKTLSMKGVDVPNTIWSSNALMVAPEIVLEIHKENIMAGARLITTNSYGIIATDLAKEGLENRYEELNNIAGQLAKQAVSETKEHIDGDVLIAASLPPLNGSYRPDRVLDRRLIEPVYRKQAELLAPYVDVFICETMSSIDEALAAATAAKKLAKPVLVALTLHDEKLNCLRSGETLTSALLALADLNIEGVLANCCLPERISDAIPLLAAADFEYCGGYANAFTHVPEKWLLDGSKENDGRLSLREDLSPDKYADFVKDWLAKGTNIVGGCCGTTAAHTGAIARLLMQ